MVETAMLHEGDGQPQPQYLVTKCVGDPFNMAEHAVDRNMLTVDMQHIYHNHNIAGGKI